MEKFKCPQCEFEGTINAFDGIGAADGCVFCNQCGTEFDLADQELFAPGYHPGLTVGQARADAERRYEQARGPIRKEPIVAILAKKPAAVAAKTPTKTAAAPKAPAKPATPAKPAATPARPTAAAKPAAAPTKGAAGANGLDPAVAKALKAMKAKWAAQREESKKGGGGSQDTSLSEGRHACKLEDFKIIVYQGSPAVIMTWTAVEGDEVGEKAVKFYGMDKDEKIGWFQRDLRRLGVEVDEIDIEQLPALGEELMAVAPTARISVKAQGDYLNVYVDKLLETEGAEPAEAGEEAAAEEPGEEVAEEPGEEVVEEAVEEAAEETGDEVVEGVTRVSFPLAGAMQPGLVMKIVDENTLHVKADSTGKVYKVPADKCEALVEEEAAA